MAELTFGAFPAIEALAFAVIEMRDWEVGQWDDLMNPPVVKVDYDSMHLMANGIPTRA